MQRYTILIIPDHRARVRRFQIAGNKLRWLAWGAGLAVLLLAVGSVDYVRARIDTRELAALRGETSQQRAQVGRMEQFLADLEGRLAKLRELERKVRVIADLPGASSEASGGQPGMGGGLDAEAQGDPMPQGGEAEEPASQPPGSGVPHAALAPAAALAAHPGHPRAVRVARLHADASRLDGLARQQELSLADLVDQLQGKSRRLASTPSIWPVHGWVTSGFGHRISPFTGLQQFHGGIDIAAGAGTPIVAPARARVVFVGRKGPLGKSAVLDHGYGIRTTYGHIKALHVTQGQVVERGERIAELGNTGRTTGPHVHYAVYVNGRAVNPFNYIFE